MASIANDSFDGRVFSKFAISGLLSLTSSAINSGDVLSFSANRTSNPKTNMPASLDLLKRSANTVLGQGH